jgi:hypothetical protein
MLINRYKCDNCGKEKDVERCSPSFPAVGEREFWKIVEDECACYPVGNRHNKHFCTVVCLLTYYKINGGKE